MEKFVLALDIGGTNTRAAIVTPDYKIKKVLINPTKTGDLQGFLDSVAEIINQICPSLEGCVAIAAGVPGRVMVDGYINDLPNIGIAEIPLGEFLEKKFNLPVFIKNDAEVAALAEAVVGPYKTAKSLYFTTISTGVGGALTINGKLRNSSNETGHRLYQYKGSLYEFERIASGTGLVKLCELNNLHIGSAKDFFALVKEKDEAALSVYKDWIALVSNWLNTIYDFFKPEVFTLTGGVMKSADIFFEDLKAACPRLNIKKCFFEQEAGLIGSAVFGYQSISE